jgi:predicted RNA-binding Zn-ribbon protein involved in translation (DUF1610 family)
MSDRNDIITNNLYCQCCGETVNLIEGVNFVRAECPKCGFRISYTNEDYRKALELKTESDRRKRDAEKHYEI